MKIIYHPEKLAVEKRPICLAAGFFDGLHRGHQRVLRAAIRKARALHGSAWVMTFDNHPLKILHPPTAPLMLTSTAHKLRFFEKQGIDGCLVLRFTPAMAALTPDEFIDFLTQQAPMLRAIFAGCTWRYGRHAAGDIATMRRRLAPKKITVTSVRPLLWRNKPVSSTRIRQAIAAGRLTDAAVMLGRPFSILGTVVTGRRIGRRIGFPTANLKPHNEVRPPQGVYAVMALTHDTPCAGVLNYGQHPTADKSRSPLMELHLLDWNGNVYHDTIEVFFIARLRSERRFPSLTALAAQIRRDTDRTRRIISGSRAKKLWKNALHHRN